MHSAVQTAVVTIISYKPLSGLNFARYTGQYGSYMLLSLVSASSPGLPDVFQRYTRKMGRPGNKANMPSSPLGVYKPLIIVILG